MPVGIFVCSGSLLVGAIAGASLNRFIPDHFKKTLPLISGLISISMGVFFLNKLINLPPIALAVIIGTIIGGLLNIEKWIERAGTQLRTPIERIFPGQNNAGVEAEDFMNQFIAVLILFCASGTGIFGAMTEGMSGDPSILYIKTILDLFTAGIFATLLGYAVMTIAIPQIVIQVALAMLAVFILPMITPSMMADFSCAGGLLMVATGLRICNIKLFPVANMLPGLVLVMPFSHLWATLVA